MLIEESVWSELDEFDEAMGWVRPQYTRNQVDKAGELFLNDELPLAQMIEPWRVLNNWRASHSFPLNSIQLHLRRHAKAVDNVCIVSQRLKRLESIERKLERLPTLQMSQMQDIGGCRAIVSSVPGIYELLKRLQSSRSKHIGKAPRDYIQEPKLDGYRGIHLVYQYTGVGDATVYNKHRIEVQIRTQAQHVWATAVEAVGTIIGQDLKSGHGDPRWLRFFALMSSAIAAIERRPSVPNTPDDLRKLRDEIISLNDVLLAQATVQAYSAVWSGVSSANAYYYLIHLNPLDRTLELQTYSMGESLEANAAYTAKEQQYRGTTHQVALTSASSLYELEKAYPNYFVDTLRFSSLIHTIIKSPDWTSSQV